MSANNGIQQLFQEGVSNVTATNSVELGTIRWVDNRSYRYAYNDGGEQISPGLGCVLVSGTTGYSVTITSVTDVTPCFGVVFHNTATTSTFFWAVTQGYVPLEADLDEALGVRELVSLGPNGVHTPYSDTTAVKVAPHGIVAQATASAGSGFGYVNCF